MKKWQKLSFVGITLLVLSLVLVGCSKPKDPTPSPTPTPSQTPDQEQYVATINDYINYMYANNIGLTTVEPIKDLDMNALEGSSFNYNDKMMYLYRLDSTNSEVSKYLNEAKSTGKVKVMVDGKEVEKYATVNKDFILIHDDAEIKDISDIFNNFDFKEYKDMK